VGDFSLADGGTNSGTRVVPKWVRFPLEKTELGEQLRSLMLTVRRGPVIHPFLFAVFPILFLWAHNVEELTLFAEPREIFVPLAISIGFTVAALVSGGLIFRDTRKAGLLVLLFLLAFYSYGHVYTSLQNAGIGDSSRQWLFFLAWASGTVFAGVLTLMIRSELRGLTNYLNVTAGALVIISLVNIGTYTLGSGTNLLDYGNKESGAVQVDVSNSSTLPDIYYILPDSYASSQVLRDLGYDNSDFTDYLTGKGFFVAYESRSNYMQSYHSLASSLNMQYFTNIEEGIPGGTSDSYLYKGLILDGRVIDTLRSLGYTIINTRDKWLVRGTSQNREQSLLYSRRRLSLNCARRSLIGLGADDFTGALLSTTALYPVLRFFNVVERQIWHQRLCEFSMIVDVKDIEGPKFVYSHLRVPHPPFVFNRNGVKDPQSISNKRCPDRCQEQYVDQVVFVNKKLKQVVHSLLSGKGDLPIIIIQSDHGTRIVDGGDFTKFHPSKFGILNAYYLPNGGSDLLYEAISPVNTFRVIFNRYFGADYELLDDRSYLTDPPFSGSTHDDVTDLIRK